MMTISLLPSQIFLTPSAVAVSLLKLLDNKVLARVGACLSISMYWLDELWIADWMDSIMLKLELLVVIFLDGHIDLVTGQH